MSYTKLLYHTVFCTKNRKNTIPEQHEKELYAYIMGIINNKKSKLYRIGGTENQYIYSSICTRLLHYPILCVK